MEHLRALLSGPDLAAAGFAGSPAPRPGPAPAARSFAEDLFEEGARAGPPQNSLAREVAAMDRQAPRGMGDDLPLDLDRREFALQDSVPESELGFGDLLDIVNPLQHIPIVGNLYRRLTGDTISGPARVAGAALYGGPVGMLAGIVNAVAAEINGNDIGGSLIASIMGDDKPSETQVAAPLRAKVATLQPAAGPPPPAASLAAQSEPAILTGDAALGALLGDLRAVSEFPMELPGLAPAFPGPVTAATHRSSGNASARARPAQAKSAAGLGFSEQMLLGMDKYRAMAIERGGAGRPAPNRVDRQL